MQLLAPLLTILTLLTPAVMSQAAAGGGAPVSVIQATQDSTIRNSPSIYTENGVTKVTYVMFTQTFATTPLGTWALGPTPRPGTIGLGDIQGTVGNMKNAKTKAKRELWRAVPTAWGW